MKEAEWENEGGKGRKKDKRAKQERNLASNESGAVWRWVLPTSGNARTGWHSLTSSKPRGVGGFVAWALVWWGELCQTGWQAGRQAGGGEGRGEEQTPKASPLSGCPTNPSLRQEHKMVKGDVLAASYGRRRSDSGWVSIILLLCAFWSVTSKKGDGSGKILERKSNMQKKNPKVLLLQVVFSLEIHLPNEIWHSEHWIHVTAVDAALSFTIMQCNNVNSLSLYSITLRLKWIFPTWV